MNRKTIIAAICAVTLIIGVFAMRGSNASEKSLNNLPVAPSLPLARLPQNTPVEGVMGIPEHIKYRHAFKYIADQAQKLNANTVAGKIPSERKNLNIRDTIKGSAELTETQSQIVEEIAAENVAQIEIFDNQVKGIVTRIRAQHPDGKLSDGEVPAPSQELADLQQMRIQTVLAGKEKLRAALGSDGFDRFEGFINSYIAPKIKIQNLPNPESLNGSKQPKLPKLLNKDQQ